MAAGQTLTKFRFGTGTTAPALGDTNLTTPFSPITPNVNNCDATTNWTATTDGSVTLNTTAGQFIEGTGALNLIKSGATTATVTYANASVTSQNFTSKRVQAMYYIADKTKLVAAGTAVSLRYGSDASNYYQKNYTQAQLSNGWNYLFFTSATADSTTGSPTITAMTYFAVVVTLTASGTTIAAPDQRLDNLLVSNQTTDDDIAFSSGFPTRSGTQITNQGFINSLQGNGLQIAEVGEVDAGDNLNTHDTFTAITKDNTVEVSITWVHVASN